MSKYSATYLVHGFNVTDGGEATIGRMVPFLKRLAKSTIVHEHKYGWFGIFSVMFKNKKVAATLKKKVSITSVASANYAIGHSNGCAIIVEAARQGAYFDRILLINPALKVDTVFPDTIGEIIVLHTKHDDATMSARVLESIPFLGWLVPNAWGSMGTHGYHGKDIRVTNLDKSNSVFGHSSIFQGSTATIELPKIIKYFYEGK